MECIETTALRPIMAATKGTWIAHGAGNADRDTVDGHNVYRWAANILSQLMQLDKPEPAMNE